MSIRISRNVLTEVEPSMSRRIAQIESTLKRAVAEVLVREISDPRITGMVSVLRVKVSPDLAHATIYVTIMPETLETKTLHGLNHAMPHIHAATRKRMSLRKMPRMAFCVDEQYKKQSRLFSDIAQGIHRSGDAQVDAPQTDAREASETFDDPPGTEKSPVS